MNTLVAQALYRAKRKNLARRVAELERRPAVAETEAVTPRESEAAAAQKPLNDAIESTPGGGIVPWEAADRPVN